MKYKLLTFLFLCIPTFSYAAETTEGSADSWELVPAGLPAALAKKAAVCVVEVGVAHVAPPSIFWQVATVLVKPLALFAFSSFFPESADYTAKTDPDKILQKLYNGTLSEKDLPKIEIAVGMLTAGKPTKKIYRDLSNLRYWLQKKDLQLDAYTDSQMRCALLFIVQEKQYATIEALKEQFRTAIELRNLSRNLHASDLTDNYYRPPAEYAELATLCRELVAKPKRRGKQPRHLMRRR